MPNVEVLVAYVLLSAISTTASLFVLIMFAIHGAQRISKLNSEFKNKVSLHSDSPISLNQFAIESEVYPPLARWYLQRKAKLFNALIDINEFGDILYYFEGARKKLLEPQEQEKA